MSESFLTSAYLIHRRRYRESSQIVDLFTSSSGRISALAPASLRQGRQRRGSSLQPFQPLQISWQGSDRDLKLLTWTEISAPALHLQGERLIAGLYLNELLFRLLNQHDVPADDLFLNYQQTLEQLHSSQPLEELLRYFECELLRCLGYGLNLEIESENGALIEENCEYCYRHEIGAVAFNTSTLAPCDGVRINGRALIQLHNCLPFDSETGFQVKRLMRYTLHHYLDGRPLHSRTLFQQLHEAKKRQRE